MSAAVSLDLDISARDFSFLAEMVRKRTGIIIRDGKIAMVRGRLARRVRALNLASIGEYCEILRKDDNEMQGLINAITTNHTSFFRERHHFDYLASNVFPDLIASGASRIRLWSAACSSGEEPYCMAATASQFDQALSRCDFRILATDIDTEMVGRAERGVYPAEAVRTVSNDVARLLGDVQAGQWTAPKRLRDKIAFRVLNLLEEWPFSGKFDVIFCRNVMIYFDQETKFNLIRRFRDALNPGGYLFIGHSESVSGAQFELDLMGRTIYRKSVR